MFHLENAGLRASILDPAADRGRLGTRYCAGGYIWQVGDAEKGDLCSGPRYPDPAPPVFDGQGLPEVFEIALGAASAAVGDEVWVIGAGRVKRESAASPFHVRDNPTLLEPAAWTVAQDTGRIAMESRQAFRDWDLRLRREVRLEGRTLVSATSIANPGGAEAAIRWFAHPFFPHAGFEVGRLSVECAFPTWVPAAGGFRIEAGRLLREPGHDWKAGCYQLLNVPFGAPIRIAQKHPLLGEVGIECRFPLAWLPLWANANTVSFEPYYHTALPPGGRAEWSILYHF